MLGEQLECVINSVYFTDQWYAEIVKMLWDAAMYGAGFLKVGMGRRARATARARWRMKSTSPVVPLRRPLRH